MSGYAFESWYIIHCSAALGTCPKSRNGSRLKRQKRCYGCENATMNGMPYKEGIKL